MSRPDRWNENEKLIFGQGFSIYGKQLREFQKMSPRKNLKRDCGTLLPVEGE